MVWRVRFFHAPLILAEPRLALTKVLTSRELTPECQASRATPTTDLNEIIEDSTIELVVIATPNPSHFELARTALVAGKHVVVDKPLTLTYAEALELDRLATAGNRRLLTFHNRRLDAHLLTVKAALESGVIGTPLLGELHFDRFRPLPKAGWRERPEPGAGLYYDLAPHLLDQGRILFGEPATITALITRQRPESQVDDSFHLVLEYDDSPRRLVLRAAMVVAAPGPRIILHGTRGSIVQTGFDEQEDELKNGKRPSDPDWGVCQSLRLEVTQMTDGGLTSSTYPPLRGTYPEFYRSLAAAIRDGSEPCVSSADSCRIMQLLEAGLRSHQSRSTIRV